MSPIDLPVTERTQLPDDNVHFIWLGQSGFLFMVQGLLILVDAYLSDFLASSHGDLPYAHDRMMDSPLGESLYGELDLVVISHGHEDHLDPLLMETLGRRNDKAKFVTPPGCADKLRSCGISPDRIEIVSHESPLSFGSAITIEAFPAAHPVCEFDASLVWSLSYRFHFAGKKILFAGDTVVYPAWSKWVSSDSCDLNILPINGRSAEKEANGIVGNMNFHEAVIVSLLNRTPLLGTHFGMFAFNTIDEHEVQEAIVDLGVERWVDLTRSGVLYSML